VPNEKCGGFSWARAGCEESPIFVFRVFHVLGCFLSLPFDSIRDRQRVEEKKLYYNCIKSAIGDDVNYTNYM
jgi:hypothetical protein